MNSSRKTCWVADHIHGVIPLSRFEKRIISTREFNRLHNVLQASTVFLTYPSNRTSRFIHSLGCAHVASQMWRSAVLNASDTCLIKFFAHIRTTIERLNGEATFSSDVRAMSPQSGPNTLTDLSLGTIFNDGFYSELLPGRLRKDEEHAYLFVLVIQAIRLVGLLHDAGHPPFSHVSEAAMTQTVDELRTSNNVPEQKHAALRDLENLTNSTRAIQLHEALGMEVARTVIEHCLRLEQQEGLTEQGLVGLLRVKHLVLRIFEEKDGVCTMLHRLIAGDIDADRIDYVIRDGVMSGLTKEALSVGRLLGSFELVCSPPDVPETKREDGRKRGPQFDIVPSVRALGMLEDLFRRRHNLYRYVIYHHRAVKTDALLREAIVSLMKEYILADGDHDAADRRQGTNEFLLPDDISGLWKVLDPKFASFDNTRQLLYVQWDDAWLLGVLRRRFLELEHRKRTSSEPGKLLSPGDEVLYGILNELLSNRKVYFSLYKRTDGFLDVERAFVSAVNRDRDRFQAFLKTTLRPKVGVEIDDLMKELSRRGTGKGVDLNGGLLLNKVDLLLLSGGTKGLMDYVTGILADLPNGSGIEIVHAIATRKSKKTGLAAEQMMALTEGRPGGQVRIGSVSTIVHDLDRNWAHFPPFFVFVRPRNESEISEMSLVKFRKKLGRLLARRLCEAQQRTERRAKN